MPGSKKAFIILIAAALPGAALALYPHTYGAKAPKAVWASAEASIAATRTLIFRDGNAGVIYVFDAGADKPFVTLERERNTFLANTVRLLASERVRRKAGGPDAPFTLTLWSDGRLTLADPQTGESVEVAAFGHTNVQNFAQLLLPKAGL